MTEECKHLNTIVRGHDIIGQGWCPDCETSIHLSTVLNNMFDAMRTLLKAKDEDEKAKALL
jgi:hypothetical protein